MNNLHIHPSYSPRCAQAAHLSVRQQQRPTCRSNGRVARLAVLCQSANGPQRNAAGAPVLGRQQPAAPPYPPAASFPPPPGGGNGLPPEQPGGDGRGGMSSLTKAFIAGAFILGMGAGIWFDTEVTFEPQNVASTVLLDQKTPNSEVCMANGYSSMVFDQRIFVSFNPFNVYVSQPEVKPGCVLRRSNFNVLESRGLVDGSQVQACKRNMNTFAFVGDLEKSPEVSCVYHSEEAENQFLRDPSKSVLGDGFQQRENVQQPSQQQ